MNDASKRALVLGGGADQALLVGEFKRRGWHVTIMDYFADPPAKAVADRHYQESCYDAPAAADIARREGVTRVATACTDQPLLVAAQVSEQLGLPFPITAALAQDLTNKPLMKARMVHAGLPTARHAVVTGDGGSLTDVSTALRYPLIVKPADSSGSRGVGVVARPAELPGALKSALRYSRCATAVVEEFIDGYEVSVDAWVVGGTAQVVMASDNFKVRCEGKTALTARSQFPSRLPAAMRPELERIVNGLAACFGLVNSPLFVQMLATDDRLYVVELSARLAGGSKPLFIQGAVGVDMLAVYVSQLLGEPVALRPTPRSGVLVTQYLYCNPGTIRAFAGFDSVCREGYVERVALYRQPGDEIKGWEHGGDRAGACLMGGPDFETVRRNDATVEGRIAIRDEQGTDLLIRGLHY